jgi:hypothetical protein
MLLFSALSGESVGAVAGTDYLGGDPESGDVLKVLVTEEGGVYPERWGGEEWVRQYFATPDNSGEAAGGGLVLWANGQRMMVGGNKNSNFSPNSPSGATFSVGTTSVNGSIEKITRTWTGTGVASGIIINETFSLVKGNNAYSRAVQIVNNTGSTLNDIRLIIGGDTYFSDNDCGYAYWDNDNRSVYIMKNMTSGSMTFNGRSDTPADKYYAGTFADDGFKICPDESGAGGSGLALSGDLDNTFSGAEHRVDTSYYLQWGNGNMSLAAGVSRTFYMTETIGGAGYLQIIAPASQVTAPGTTVNFEFLLKNMTAENDPDVLVSNLTATSSQGWDVTITPVESSLGYGEELKVLVSVQVPQNAEVGLSDVVTLSADYAGEKYNGTISTGAEIFIEGTPVVMKADIEVPDTGIFGGVFDKIKSMPFVAVSVIAVLFTGCAIMGVRGLRKNSKITRIKK